MVCVHRWASISSTAENVPMPVRYIVRFFGSTFEHSWKLLPPINCLRVFYTSILLTKLSFIQTIFGMYNLVKSWNNWLIFPISPPCGQYMPISFMTIHQKTPEILRGGSWRNKVMYNHNSYLFIYFYLFIHLVFCFGLIVGYDYT